MSMREILYRAKRTANIMRLIQKPSASISGRQTKKERKSSRVILLVSLPLALQKADIQKVVVWEKWFGAKKNAVSM